MGRRSGDLILLDLGGKVCGKVHQPYDFQPPGISGFCPNGIAKLVGILPESQRPRISGLGIAAPFELWNWQEEVGAPHDVLEAWRGFDLMGELAELWRFSGFPVQ